MPRKALYRVWNAFFVQSKREHAEKIPAHVFAEMAERAGKLFWLMACTRFTFIQGDDGSQKEGRMSIDKITGWFRVANSNPKFSDLSPIAECLWR